MIQHEELYLEYIKRRGVGAKDQSGSDTPASYVSFLNGVSRVLGTDISPELLHSEEDIDRIVKLLQGHYAPGTIRNDVSVMRQYIAMVQEYKMWEGSSGTVENAAPTAKLEMTMPIQAVAVPLFDDGQGGLRVTGTRVLLERIVHAFEDGATPEGIVQSYDTLQLADVYAVLTWYLRHRAEVEQYLRQRAEEAELVRRTIEAKQPDRAELRARLMARRVQKEVAHAPPGQ